MGVPAFFRWLTRKYPSVVIECREDVSSLENGGQIDPDEPNPNEVEFDNLYLDMNGIIHPCTHPENKPPPADENEMFLAIFENIDRLINIVRPRRLLYLAIDGVAPRAKMNQQRSRRFRAAKETAEKAEQMASLKAELRAKGVELPPDKKSAHFDSNCITPGTEFMSRLSTSLHYYILDRLTNNSLWQRLKVILSDASVPGEGEHKIMDFIRRQRALKDHDPNTHHCLCGADADLIMLGLATHELYFTIIREEFVVNQPRKCEICGQLGHEMKECMGLPNTEEGSNILLASPTKYIFVRLSVLREYLEQELFIPDLTTITFDFERALDDWIFMCFFVGNDFLPHLPSLEIRENAIDRLISLYKRTVKRTIGYLTDSGDVHLARVQLIMNELGDMENEIFKKRKRNEDNFKVRMRQRKKDERISKLMHDPGNKYRAPEELELEVDFQLEREANAEAHPDDVVRFHEKGYKDRYYQSKFNLPSGDQRTRIKIAHEYVRGLCWVLKYYYQGCASWKWYYPYHYAPFSADFHYIEQVNNNFESDTVPFSPLEQLMGVFPAASGNLVPPPFSELMTDKDSPILDFYPSDFMVDLNGKKFAWQGVALLPFVDESRLKEALEPRLSMLTDEESARNKRGQDILYGTDKNDCYPSLLQSYISNRASSNPSSSSRIVAKGICGSVFFLNHIEFEPKSLVSPIRGLPNLSNISAFCVAFRDPQLPNHKFQAFKHPEAVTPPKVLASQSSNGAPQNFDNSKWRRYDPKSVAESIGNSSSSGMKRPASTTFSGETKSVAFLNEAACRFLYRSLNDLESQRGGNFQYGNNQGGGRPSYSNGGPSGGGQWVSGSRPGPSDAYRHQGGGGGPRRGGRGNFNRGGGNGGPNLRGRQYNNGVHRPYNHRNSRFY